MLLLSARRRKLAPGQRRASDQPADNEAGSESIETEDVLTHTQGEQV